MTGVEEVTPFVGPLLECGKVGYEGVRQQLKKRRKVKFIFQNYSSEVLHNPSNSFWNGKVVGLPDYRIEGRTGELASGGEFKGSQVRGVLWYEIGDTGYVLLVIVKVLWFRGVKFDNERRNQVGVAIVPQIQVYGLQLNKKKEIYRKYEHHLEYCDGQPQYRHCKASWLKVLYTISSAGNAEVKIIIRPPPDNVPPADNNQGCGCG